MTLTEYQRAGFAASRIDWKTPAGRQVAILGVLGEVGSIATVMKKRIRDGASYSRSREDLMEETGDVLWYLAAMATHYGLDLAQCAQDAHVARPLNGDNGHLWSLIDGVMLMNSILAADGETFSVNPIDLADPLGETANMVLHAIEREGLDLDEVLDGNLRKTSVLFNEVSGPAPQFDRGLEPYELLPRSEIINFLQRTRPDGSPQVLMRVRGFTIGDRLTDNSRDGDGYRFHDALHLGYVAVLGWSPVFRALMRCKRKNDPATDEQQDGARAIVIEEAITQQIFNHARDHNMFKNITRIDHGLLKWVVNMVRGLETEHCSAAEWQRAILQGYSAFRALKENDGGYLTIDAEKRELRFSPTNPDDHAT